MAATTISGSLACKAPSSDTFSFKAPFPSITSTTTTVKTNGPLSPPNSAPTPLKQRRVSLALPSSPRLLSAWPFRDDTGLTSSSSVATVTNERPPSPSDLVPTKRGKMRKIANDDDTGKEKEDSEPVEKKQRKKWTLEETQMLVDGCNTWGVGNWKAILKDPNLRFDNRSPVDLKDRFRTYFPDAYKQHYPNAKTHLSSKIRSTLPDGSPLFEKTRSKKRRPFTSEEDAALKAGYEKHGTVWATIVKDPIFQEQNRRSTDLRDRFRNAFPDLYQAAGYKPRGAPRKKALSSAASAGDVVEQQQVRKKPVRAATDDQLAMSSAGVSRPTRRRRAQTSQGLLRGGTKSVPESTANSEDEASSGAEDDNETFPEMKMLSPTLAADVFETPNNSISDAFGDLAMETMDDPLPDPLGGFSDFSTTMTRSPAPSDAYTWSSGAETPLHSTAATTWSSSTTTGSPTSEYLLCSGALSFRSGMIGKSAWGTNDWFSPNPRMDPDLSNASSFAGTSSGSPHLLSSAPPFSFHTPSSHGVLDRYDLFPASFAHVNHHHHHLLHHPGHGHMHGLGLGLGHDYASSEVDAHSTFSDPEAGTYGAGLGLGGFTHHSNYAGDLIFGARNHSHGSGAGFGFGFGLGGAGSGGGSGGGGLGLSGVSLPVSQSAGIHPMQLHTPALPLPGIDEIPLPALDLSLPSIDEIEQLTLNDQVELDVPKDSADNNGNSGSGNSSNDNSSNNVVGGGTSDAENASAAASRESEMANSDSISDLGLAGFSLLAQAHLEDLVDLSHSTPPATPLMQPRPFAPSTPSHRHHSHHLQHHPGHTRSTSVPPFEHRAVPSTAPSSHHAFSTNEQQQQPPPPHISATRSLPSFDSLVQEDDPFSPGLHSYVAARAGHHHPTAHDLSDLPFLDLHYYMGALDAKPDGGEDECHSTKGQAALDLAQSNAATTMMAVKAAAAAMPPPPLPLSLSSTAPLRAHSHSHSLHYRGQHPILSDSATSSSRQGSENKRKRASWDGGIR